MCRDVRPVVVIGMHAPRYACIWAHEKGRRLSTMVLAVVLTLIAGYVDAIGFLRLGGIYVAHMSGNSIAVGIHTALGPFPTVLHRLLPIGAYVVGLLVARIILNLGSRRRIRRLPGLCLAGESLLLIFFINISSTNGVLLSPRSRWEFRPRQLCDLPA